MHCAAIGFPASLCSHTRAHTSSSGAMAASFTANDELRMLELGLSILKEDKQALAEAQLYRVAKTDEKGDRKLLLAFGGCAAVVSKSTPGIGSKAQGGHDSAHEPQSHRAGHRGRGGRCKRVLGPGKVRGQAALVVAEARSQHAWA